MAPKNLLIALIVVLSVRSGDLEVTYSATSEEQQNDSSIDAMVMMRSAKVVLHPPKNITFFLVTSNEAVIGWLPPEVYKMHDVNTTLIDPPFNETMIWLNHTYPQWEPSRDSTESKPVPTENSTTSETENGTSTDSEVTEAPPLETSPHELCHSLDYYVNYTVNVNTTEKALKDYRPHLITMKDIFKAENVTADTKNTQIVSFSQGCVREYHVFYWNNQSEATMVQVNASEQPEVHLTSLTPGTTYTILVAAVFVSNRTLNSSSVTFNTATASEPTIKCMCDWHGTLRRSKECDKNISQPCSCRPAYQGQFCERCAPGYYRTAPYFPCHRCPCAHHATRDAACKFEEGFLKCTQCETGYTGNICHMCAYGYYRHHKYCVPCNCNNNHNRSLPYMCDVITGACYCTYNTSGMNCETCRTGFIGDALHARNCTEENWAMSVFKVLPQGVIAGICVGAILLISFIVGCVIYWRMSMHPPKRPFWTVELKNDHEGVNFNTVPNDDFQIVDPKLVMDDMEFYEQQGGAAQSHSGGADGKKYARLQEHV